MGQFFLIVSVIAQIYFIYHAIVRKKYLWALAIFFFPLFGLLGYYFMEYRQSAGTSRKFELVDENQPAGNFFGGGAGLERLRDKYEAAPSFVNKIALADGLQKEGQFEEAIELYESSVGGINEDDLTLWQGLAHAYFHTRQFEKAKNAVLKLRQYRDTNQVNDFDLLLAQALEELGEDKAALEEYEFLSGKYNGEEARCKYALLLKKMGEQEAAEAVFKEILNHSRLSPVYYKRKNQVWISIASKELNLR